MDQVNVDSAWEPLLKLVIQRLILEYENSRSYQYTYLDGAELRKRLAWHDRRLKLLKPLEGAYPQDNRFHVKDLRMVKRWLGRAPEFYFFGEECEQVLGLYCYLKDTLGRKG